MSATKKKPKTNKLLKAGQFNLENPTEPKKTAKSANYVVRYYYTSQGGTLCYVESERLTQTAAHNLASETNRPYAPKIAVMWNLGGNYPVGGLPECYASRTHEPKRVVLPSQMMPQENGFLWTRKEVA